MLIRKIKEHPNYNEGYNKNFDPLEIEIEIRLSKKINEFKKDGITNLLIDNKLDPTPKGLFFDLRSHIKKILLYCILQESIPKPTITFDDENDKTRVYVKQYFHILRIVVKRLKVAFPERTSALDKYTNEVIVPKEEQYEKKHQLTDLYN